MAISFVGYSFSATGTATSRTLTEPSGTQENDLVIGFCQGKQNTTLTWADPSDFTRIDGFSTTAGDPLFGLYVGHKVRGATAGQPLTFSHDDTADTVAVAVLVYRGIDTSSPFDVSYLRASHFAEGAPNIANMTAQPITTSTDNAWVLLLQGVASNISDAAGPPSGYTVDMDTLTGAGVNRGLYAVHRLIATFTTETPGAFTHSDDGVGADPDPYAFTLALKPSTASVNTTITVPTGPQR